MIKYLELRNWRAFSKLILHLGGGTTFLVAENGIGKTSVLRGAAWTLFAPSHIDPRAEVRLNEGGKEATGVVVFSTAEGDLEIERTCRPGGRPSSTLQAQLAGVQVSPEDLPALLARLTGVHHEIACQLGFVHQHALRTDQELFTNVGQFLRHLTGVDDMQASHAGMQKLMRRLSNQATDLGKRKREHDSDTGALEADIQVADKASIALTAALDAALSIEKESHATLALAEQWNEYDLSLLQFQESQRQLNERVSALLGTANLEASKQQTEAEQSAIGELDRGLKARANLHQQLGTQLSDVDAECPLCRQSIDDDQLQRAADYHEHATAEAVAEANQLQAKLAALSTKLSELRALEDERRVLVPPVGPTMARPTIDQLDAEAATENVEDLHGRIAQHKAEQALRLKQLDEARSDKRNEIELIRIRRSEAAATAAVDVLHRSIAHHVRTRIDPLSLALAEGWGQFFVAEGRIDLDAQGRISLVRESGPPLPYEQLSGGQQMLATLTMRLCLVSAATQLGSVWLDEPLEHLDPSNRRRAANLLVQAPRSDPRISQVVATTYEEETARRLAATNSDVDLRYIRAELA